MEPETNVSALTQLETLHQEGIFLLDRVVEEPVCSQETFEKIQDFVHRLVQYVAQHPEMALDWATNASAEVDVYLVEHTFNVCLMGVIFGIQSGYSDEDLKAFTMTAFLHDIGMFDLPYSLVYRTQRFDETTRSQMQQHPYLSVRRLQHLEELPGEVIFSIRDEHERNDGSGYPEQKPADVIHHFAKALHMLDIYEALIHARPYRETAMHPQQAIRHLILMARQGLLDGQAVRHWLNRIAFYPIGSMVRLNNGSIGKVIGSHPHYPLQPIVALFRDVNAQPLSSPQIVDLAQKSHFHIAEIISPASLEPESESSP